MKQSFFNTKTLNQIPPILIFFLLIILVLPVLIFNVLRVDFSFVSHTFGFYNQHNVPILRTQFHHFFLETILQWSAFALAVGTTIFSFLQYRLTNDKIALIIEFTVLFSGAIAALHILIVDGVTPQHIDKPNLDAIIWTLSNIISGLTLLIGMSIILKQDADKTIRLPLVILINLLLLLTAFTLVYYTVSRMNVPQLLNQGALISRPYELIYLGIYLIIALFLYPPLYKKYPYILTNAIFYMAVTEIVVAIYRIFLSNDIYDHAFNAAYFLKIIFYFIPFACCIVNYVFSYNTILETELALQINTEKLDHLATYDELTGFYNLRSLDNQINQQIAMSATAKTTFALFIINIDNFKLINEDLGHIQADKYIKKFAEQLSTLTHKTDILTRVGGDEFAVISMKTKTKRQATSLAKQLLVGLNTPHQIEEHTIGHTASIGVAFYPTDGKTAQELLRKADIAMYAAKSLGKNTFQFFTAPIN